MRLRVVFPLLNLFVLAVVPASGAVDHRAFSASALEDARQAGRPVALVVSRKGCPRCTAYETAALSDPRIQAVLEGRFFALALDAEERPDLAGALADSLPILPHPRPAADPGLTLLMVLTPDLRPLDGTGLVKDGRLLGPESLLGFLTGLADAWDADRPALEVKGGLTLAALREAQAAAPPAPTLTASLLDRPLAGLREAFDRRRSAFGLPPRRLPHGPLSLLFEEHRRTGDRATLGMATAVLDAILASPLRGPGGGFHREALGEDWSHPVTEQTLADNALLLGALLEAHEATGQTAYGEAAAGIAGFLRTVLADESGAFRQARAFEGSEERRDDRVFAYANGLALSALARSGRVLGRADDLRAATQAAEAVLARLGPPASLVRHAAGADRRGPALLADHAFLAAGLLDLHEATGATRWLAQARAVVDAAVSRYSDPAGSGFFESAEDGEPRPARRRDAYDGLLPSPNAAMVSALRRLGRATGERIYADLARRTALAFAPDLARAPRGLESFGAAVGELLGPASSAQSSAGPSPAADPASGRATSGKVEIEARVEPGRVRAGGKATLQVTVRAADGTYVIAHRALTGDIRPRDVPDLLPLALAFPGAVFRVGSPSYPAGDAVALAGSPAPVLAHGGSGPGPAAVVTAPVTIPQGRGGEQRLRVRVSFQPCDAKACGPPERVTLEAPFTVEP